MEVVRLAALGFMLLGLTGAKPARGESLDATLHCPERFRVGRIACEIEVRPSLAAQRLAWVDAVVIEAPPFAPPLRNRVTPQGQTAGAAAPRLPLALLATDGGEGTLSVRLRAVLCARSGETEHCVPVVKTLSTGVRVELGAP